MWRALLLLFLAPQVVLSARSVRNTTTSTVKHSHSSVSSNRTPASFGANRGPITFGDADADASSDYSTYDDNDAPPEPSENSASTPFPLNHLEKFVEGSDEGESDSVVINSATGGLTINSDAGSPQQRTRLKLDLPEEHETAGETGGSRVNTAPRRIRIVVPEKHGPHEESDRPRVLQRPRRIRLRPTPEASPQDVKEDPEKTKVSRTGNHRSPETQTEVADTMRFVKPPKRHATFRTSEPHNENDEPERTMKPPKRQAHYLVEEGYDGDQVRYYIGSGAPGYYSGNNGVLNQGQVLQAPLKGQGDVGSVVRPSFTGDRLSGNALRLLKSKAPPFSNVARDPSRFYLPYRQNDAGFIPGLNGPQLGTTAIPGQFDYHGQAPFHHQVGVGSVYGVSNGLESNIPILHHGVPFRLKQEPAPIEEIIPGDGAGVGVNGVGLGLGANGNKLGPRVPLASGTLFAPVPTASLIEGVDVTTASPASPGQVAAAQQGLQSQQQQRPESTNLHVALEELDGLYDYERPVGHMENYGVGVVSALGSHGLGLGHRTNPLFAALLLNNILLSNQRPPNNYRQYGDVYQQYLGRTMRQYAKYMPYGIGSYGLYGYSASNNLHNSNAFGAYKYEHRL